MTLMQRSSAHTTQRSSTWRKRASGEKGYAREKRRKCDSWKKGTLEKNVASVIRVLATSGLLLSTNPHVQTLTKNTMSRM